MKRADYQATGSAFLADSSDAILGSLTANSFFAVDMKQRNAWLAIIVSLKSTIAKLEDSYVFLEFAIPRMGRRVDAIILSRGCVFVLEYKIGSSHFYPADVDQVVGYALDLKNFHEPSHQLPMFPLLIATNAKSIASELRMSDDRVCEPMHSDGTDIADLINRASSKFSGQSIDPMAWVGGRYRPTPTIIEAAQALYRNHRVDDITRNEAGAENLSLTAAYVSEVIHDAKRLGTKAICFVTGVPGSGKTLAGLDIANSRTRNAEDEYAVFLSGNGPLVKVLRAALARDQKNQIKESGAADAPPIEANRSVEQFIQNIHHFRDANVVSELAPIEKVVIFDEAQRAWNMRKATQFMRTERNNENFCTSEPEFLLSVMDRHDDWCTVICLVGNGQEINTGEAGINEWLTALATQFPTWQVHLSDRIVNNPETFGVSQLPKAVIAQRRLHLSTAIRSFRSESVSAFASAMIDGRPDEALALSEELTGFEFRITRDLATAREWLRQHRRGTERAGVLAFSNAVRLKPEGVFVKATIDPVEWFLADRSDVRSSDYLEDIATEFDVQGLELDWACVCIDANLRVTETRTLEPMTFRGTKWQAVNDSDRRKFILNAHRVLLTRARQGVVVFLPKGDKTDPTRDPAWYERLFSYFVECGLKQL
ncbi:MAG: DUF2075 domain-containing protein [Acidobacteria bacterium]|nr:DUF2075 domain-containing protein [Acidobacteriota bacterium]